jgi:transposase
MLIDQDKQPIGYKVFKGDTFEGHTFEHAIKDLKDEYQIEKVIVVADRGMLSAANLEVTVNNGYEFIVGERLRKLPREIQEPLLDTKNYTATWTYENSEGEEVIVRYCTVAFQGRTIIGTFSAKRAKKDAYDREVKLKTAEKLLKNPSLVAKKAGRFFLKKEGETTYELDKQKIERDKRFDGFLAIATNNTTLDVNIILEQYKQLYRIEHTFRTFKSHLETRPMFHWTDKRIEGHLCLCYLSYTLLNYTLLKLKRAGVKTTETQLRKTLERMQVSLIEQNDKEYYLRSAVQPLETLIQQKLGLNILPSVFADGDVSQLI